MPPKKDITLVNHEGRAKEIPNANADDNDDIDELEDDNEDNHDNPEFNDLTRGQKAAANRKKNQDRFESIERAIENMSKAIQQLAKDKQVPHGGTPKHINEVEVTVHQQPHNSRTSTPKKKNKRQSSSASVGRHKGIDDSQANGDQTQHELNSVMGEARGHADSMLDSLNPAFQRTNGRQLVDVYTGRPAVVPMPRHFVDIRSQQRIKLLDDKNDLTLPEFLPGFL